jgi:PAS fold
VQVQRGARGPTCIVHQARAGEIIGRSHYEILTDIPQRWRKLHARVLAGEELGHEEDPFPRQDGRVERVEWSMKPWRTADGRVGGACCSANS